MRMRARWGGQACACRGPGAWRVGPGQGVAGMTCRVWSASQPPCRGPQSGGALVPAPKSSSLGLPPPSAAGKRVAVQQRPTPCRTAPAPTRRRRGKPTAPRSHRPCVYARAFVLARLCVCGLTRCHPGVSPHGATWRPRGGTALTGMGPPIMALGSCGNMPMGGGGGPMSPVYLGVRVG